MIQICTSHLTMEMSSLPALRTVGDSGNLLSNVTIYSYYAQFVEFLSYHLTSEPIFLSNKYIHSVMLEVSPVVGIVVVEVSIGG